MNGTGNFSNSNLFFTVSIALAKNNEVILGVVYAPFLQELYYVEKGKGSFLNGEQLKVSTTNSIESSYVVTCECGSKSNERMSNIYSKVFSIVKNIRKIELASPEASMVAFGRLDIFITLNISSWDVVAGILIANKAGGMATNFKGENWKIEKTDLIVSNKIVHESLRERISEM